MTSSWEAPDSSSFSVDEKSTTTTVTAPNGQVRPLQDNDFTLPPGLYAALSDSECSHIATVSQITCAADYRRSRKHFHELMTSLANKNKDYTRFARAHILRVRDLLHREIAKPGSFDYSPLVDALANHDERVAVRQAEIMLDRFREPPEVLEVEKYLNLFPLVVKESKAKINSAYIGRAVLGQEHGAEDVALGQCRAGYFMCPILYQDETDPIILVTCPRNPTLNGFTKWDTRELIDCPLSAMIHSRFLQEFLPSIDHPISLAAFREAIACGHPITISPISRKPILGALTLGSHQSHVDATNWTLMQLLSGGKKMGNPDLWFACLWLLVEDGKIPYLTDVLPHIREHMIFRLRNSFAPASLTGLPGFVNFRVPLAAACWFSLASCLATDKCTKDTIRVHMRHTRPLFKLCELAGYSVPESVQLYNKRLRVLFTLRILAAESFPRFQSLVRALYQKSIILKNVSQDVRARETLFTEVIPMDGPADDAQIEQILQILPKYCRDISLQDVIGIGALITSGSIPISQIDMGVDWKPPRVPKPAVFWKHYQDKIDPANPPPYEICPATLHPYYKPPDGPTWRAVLKRIVGSGPIFSDCHFCGLFFNRYKFVPTPDDLLAFIHCRYSRSGFAPTLPFCCREFAAIACEKFKAAVGSCPVPEARSRFIKCQDVKNRQEAERAYLAEQRRLPHSKPEEEPPKESGGDDQADW